MEWLHPRLQNDDIITRDFNSGGHFVLLPKGRILLDRFERVKHAFSGTESGDISLPRGTIVSTGQQDDLESGVISLKPYVKLFNRVERETDAQKDGSYENVRKKRCRDGEDDIETGNTS